MIRKCNSKKRYTLPYREETVKWFWSAFLIMIHPPIQGGNCFCCVHGDLHADTPSHTGRKRELVERNLDEVRYTLPYREETESALNTSLTYLIHPPIQGGNDSSQQSLSFHRDTPSHTGRKPSRREHILTFPPIHPPIQGGNDRRDLPGCAGDDTPSHTGRKPDSDDAGSL